MTQKATQKNRPAAVQTALGDDALLLRSFTIRERLSEPFQIELDLLSEDGSIAFDSVVGKPATIRLGTLEKPRYFNGIVTRFGQGCGKGQYSAYRATVAPAFWILSLSSHCRIFKDKSVVEIVRSVLSEHQVEFEERIHGNYAPLEFCVQYRETDIIFCSRLLEEFGIYYYFTHSAGKHTLILTDSRGSHDAFPGYETIDYRPHSGPVIGGEYIYDWSVRHNMMSTRFAHQDYDFTKPTSNLLQKAGTNKGSQSRELEIYDYPGGYTELSKGETLAKVRMDEIGTHSEYRNGSTSAYGIATGHRFRLGRCPDVGFPRTEDSKEYLVVSAEHSFHLSDYESENVRTASPYKCTFVAIPHSEQFRPARVTPKPLIHGVQTAMVVGRKGREIDTDQYGRIRVQFHWDRDGKRDENSSCWIRVAQSWTGRKWGAIYTPRIGQEVVVEFLEGDPDRPIVTGCIYNGENMPPFTLPEKDAVSGVKTNSTKGGAGYNEWTMDDTKGQEKIVLHGQKDWETKIENDRKTVIVRNDELTVTKGDQTTTVTAGKCVIEARQSIELRVGSSKVRIDSTGVTIEGIICKISGTAQASMNAPLTTVTASGILTLKGGLTIIA